MKRLDKFFSEEDEQGIPDYSQYNRPPERQDSDGGSRYDNRNERRQRFNDRGDRGGGFQRPRQDNERERQQREYEIKKVAETRAELKALKEAMKANEDPYKDAMRREDYYRARRKRDLAKLMWLGLATAGGYLAGHHFGASDKEAEMKKEAEQQKKKNLLSRIFSDPETANMVAQHLDAQAQGGMQGRQATANIGQASTQGASAQTQNASRGWVRGPINALSSMMPNEKLARRAQAMGNQMAAVVGNATSKIGKAYDYVKGLFSDPESVELITKHFNTPGMYGAVSQYTSPTTTTQPQQVHSPQQPLQSASITPTTQHPQVAQRGGASQTGDEAKIQQLDSEIATLKQDNMAKQQQLQQLSQQNLAGAMRNIQNDYTARDNMKSVMNAAGNVVRGVGSGVFNAAGDALGAAWNGAKTLFASNTISEMEKYFAEQGQNVASIIKQKTEVRDKLKEQNKELAEAVDDKENSLGTMFYQLSAASPMAAGQILGGMGNMANNAVIGGINLANQAYNNITGGKQLVNTSLITTNDGTDLATQQAAEKEKLEAASPTTQTQNAAR